LAPSPIRHADTQDIGRDQTAQQYARNLPPHEQRDSLFGAFPMALGHDVVACHGVRVEKNRAVVFTHNYTSADRCLQTKTLFPPNITPEPATDFSVAILAAAATQPGETALTHPLQPGMESYLRTRGVLADGAKLLEVNSAITAGETIKLGWPYTDVVTLAHRAQVLPKDAIFIASLPTNHTAELVLESGGLPIQKSSAMRTNNKVVFQRDAERFGYKVIDGMIIAGRAELVLCALRYKDATRVWVKHATAAGGDAVIAVAGPITVEKLECAAARLHSLENETEIRTGFSRAAIESLSPEFVVQLDAGVDPVDLKSARKIHTIGGVLFRVSHDSTTEIHSYHEQETINGVFYGSKPYSPTPKARAMIDALTLQVGTYCAQELKLYGNLGLDLVVVENLKGDISVELIELNGRPNATTISRIIAEAVHAPHWQQVTIKTEMPLNDFCDIENFLGKDTLLAGDNDGPQFVVMGLGSLYKIGVNGMRELLVSANYAKVLVIGKNPEQVRVGLDYIAARKALHLTLWQQAADKTA